MPRPYASVVDVLLLLTRGDHVLLAREAAEDVGSTIQPPDEAQLVATVHNRNLKGSPSPPNRTSAKIGAKDVVVR